MVEGVIDASFVSTEIKKRCESALEHLKVELGKLRSGRAAPSVLEGVTVEYYGSRVPLIQMGMVGSPEPRLLTVQVYDGGAVEAVEKAIRDSGLGLNPQREGVLLRIPVPSLTEARRKELVKRVKEEGEQGRVRIRNIRRDLLELIKKGKDIPEDASRRFSDQIQKGIDLFIKQVDELVIKKEQELLEV
jgi:ribosome recycling factor